MAKQNIIIVKDANIRTMNINGVDYICITDIARQKNAIDPNGVIGNWMRNRNTIEFLGLWETLYNPNFNPLEFEGFRNQAGLNAFTLSATQWTEKTNAIGLISKAGRYGGTYARSDIAFKFANWVSVYRIHTDAIKSHLIPDEVTKEQANIIYAEEADVLNVAMFGMTAKQWREANPELKGNIRDYATINELICLSNMENINAVLINDGMPQGERLVKLNQIAIQQMQVLEGNNDRKLLK